MNRKLYPCKNCGREVPIRSKGLCGICRNKQRDENGELPKKTYKIPKFTAKNQKKRKEERSCLGNYFKLHIELLERSPKSQESGLAISSPSAVNICHIFPKRIYKSVQCNIDNCVYLTWQEHTRFDKLLDEMNLDQIAIEFPNTWPIVLKKVEKLMPLLLEKKKLFHTFVEYIERKEQ